MNSIDSGPCVLLVTRQTDPTADHVLRRMAEREIPHLRVNGETFGDVNIALHFPNVSDSVLSIEGARVAIGQIRAVWLRRLAKPKAGQITEAEARAFAESELDFTLRWLIGLLSKYCPVLDSETRVLDGNNKLHQLATAAKYGLRIPETLITNDPDVARDFVRHHEKVAIKSVAGYGQEADGGFFTVYTNIVTDHILNRFDSIRLAPVCLQKYVDKEFELRITVVGQRVFACRIDSQITKQTHVDWRRYDNSTPYSIYVTDEDLNNSLFGMMRDYGIRFAAFDLVVTPDGESVFLEINPAGQFLWIEELTGMPITDAIIDELLG